ncbi:d-lactate dehydrogenase [Chrysochromulina tobinii]|uniref:D-lactate dehydrogenase n=1 Tax=Chrysochromulina tobinii TaxID=1460289 RepID=A0A0M0J967_9EUKA|nr:d-lactate dehydrogenase [Chrysochromulina tobinii]|eukprot:KOO22778.1 d-lactate dehydrogenase [Chrysochromulina sp. CCMP291]
MDSDKPSAPEKLREEVAKAKEHGDSTTEQPIIAVFSAREYEEAAFEAALAAEKAAEPDGKLPYAMRYIEAELNPQTVKLAQDCAAVCVFVNDGVSKEVLDWLGRYTSCRLILLRCAGFNNVDLAAAAVNKISVARVPAYSPYAVAEHAVALCMTLNRKIHKAYLRNRDGNFSLRGLTGFDMHGRTVGIIGTGNIGVIAANIFLGFGCKVIAQSRSVNKELADKGVEYVTLDELCKRCDIISLHAPMTKETHHCINEARIALMKKGVMIINTSRGGLLDTKAAIAGLKNKTIGALGLDVYEEESGLFFHDHTGEVLEDDVFQQLVNYPNVIVTGHQAFLTEDALRNIADATLFNMREHLAKAEKLTNGVVAADHEVAAAKSAKATARFGALKRIAAMGGGGAAAQTMTYYDKEDDQ